MTKNIQAIRGMNDILPEQTPYWFEVESVYRSIVSRYGYREIRLPILEQTSLFLRGVGALTDIVEKEMYNFTDRNGDLLTLRPEGTAGCVRAGIEHGLLYHQMQRLWYAGPMFRHERPQRGRYRQFHHLGAEVYGMPGPDIDAEIILMIGCFLKELGLSKHVVLQLNTLGNLATRVRYREILLQYLMAHKDLLDEEGLRRLASNPLRILDSKNPALASMIAQAPKIIDCLDEGSRCHFDGLCALLERANQPYVIAPTLVRGLDYYCFTVFEWVSDALGAQGTVAGGGRYDNLVELLGGNPTPAIGFSAGVERLVLLLEKLKKCEDPLDIFVIIADPSVAGEGVLLVEQLRASRPDLSIETGLGGASVKSQWKRALQRGVHWVVQIGVAEMQQSVAKVSAMRNLSSAEPGHFDLVAFSALGSFSW